MRQPAEAVLMAYGHCSCYTKDALSAARRGNPFNLTRNIKISFSKQYFLMTSNILLSFAAFVN